jgi:hypothetical protein
MVQKQAWCIKNYRYVRDVSGVKCTPPPHYIKRPQGRGAQHNFLWRKSHERSLHLLGAPATPPLHVVALRSFWIPSNAVYFCNLSWIRDSGAHRDRRTCASMRRCRSCGAGVIAPRSPSSLRSAMSSSSSTLVPERNPRIRSMRVPTSVYCCRITKDRSLSNLGLRRNKFLLFASNPNIWIHILALVSMHNPLDVSSKFYASSSSFWRKRTPNWA